MAPPKKNPRKEDPNQQSISLMFKKKSNELENSLKSIGDTIESKQNVLIDMSVNQVKSENGTDWTILFDFDIHFTEQSSQQIDAERDVECESAPTSRASSATTSRAGTPMETEDEDYDGDNSDGDTANIGASKS